MSGAPETIYKGFKVRYSENEDEWNAYELNVSDPRLGKLKAKIDKILREARKSAAIPAVLISGIHHEPRDVNVVEIKEIKIRSRGWSMPEPVEHISVWYMENGRSCTGIDRLWLPSPELDHYMEVRRASLDTIKRAQKDAEDALAKAPRLDKAALAELIRLHEAEAEKAREEI